MRREKRVKAEGIKKYMGLMFKRENYTTPMVFEFERPTLHPIHTWFCNFPIRCIYYDEKGKIIEDVILEEWTTTHVPPRPYVKLLEIPNPYSTTMKGGNNKNGIQTKRETEDGDSRTSDDKSSTDADASAED